MFRGRVPIAVAVAVLLLVLLARAPGGGTAADEPRPPAADADFAGKVLAINTDSADKVWTVLEKVEVRTIRGRSFLVGKGVDDGREGNFYKGRTLWIAVDRVMKMVEFANLQEYRKISGGEQP